MMDPTLAWARSLFRRYYRREPVLLPPRFGRREFGFIFLGEKGMQRHTAFPTRQDLSEFMAKKGPCHSYYSAAYYEQPDATEMEAKGWLGADLIFDLDADHLPGAEGKPFEEIMEEVRVEAVKVAEEFLVGHFGVDEGDMRIAFSGGRGYHIHVTRPDVQPLDSHARREIVDYVTGNGLAVERLLRRETFATSQFQGHTSEKKRWTVPPADTPGWRGLFTRTLVAELERLSALDHEQAIEQLTELPGIGDTRAEQLIEQLTPERLEGVRAGRVDQVPTLADKRVLSGLAERTRVQAVGEADEPVTADVKRLIRLPGSLHGKTGFRVTPLTLDELKGFDPFDEAVALGDDPVEVELQKPADCRLKGERYDLEPGVHEVPEHVAAYLCLQFAGGGPPWRPTLAQPQEAEA